MTWTFDTGRTSSQRHVVLDAVITALQPLLVGNADGFALCVEPFGGVVRSYVDDDGVDMLYALLNGRAPSIAVGLGDKRYVSRGMHTHEKPNHGATLDIIVYFCNRNQSTMQSRLDGDAGVGTDVGVFHAMERVEELLIGLEVTQATLAPGSKPATTSTYKPKPGKDIKHLIPLAEEELRTTPELTLWKQTYSVELTRSINKLRAVTDRVTSILTTVKTTDPVPGSISEISTFEEP